VVRLDQASRLFRPVSAGLCIAGCLATGCSSRQFEPEPPARVTASADPVRRTIRPIPDVIAKPRPFRLPDSLGSAAGSSLHDHPVTMQAEVAAASRVAAAVPAGPVDEASAPAPLDLPPATGFARPFDSASTAPAVAEIRGMMREYLRAFNRHDPAALAAHWSQAGESIDLDSGQTTRGRPAVEEIFSTLFEEDAGATIDIDITAIRPVREDVAVVDGVSLLSFSDEVPTGSRFTAVVAKQDGRWMLESVREAAVPLPAAAGPSPLEQLSWLVGCWEDVGADVTAGTHCFWSADKAFLIRSHAVTRDETAAPTAAAAAADGIPELLAVAPAGTCEITEIIGWDPSRKQVRSWLFSSAGRFAEGTWSREGDAWRVCLAGGGPDTAADCVYTLSRVGADEIAVGGDAGRLAGLMPPAADFVRTARPWTADRGDQPPADRP
jgi:uncharacterized protein (TIGR02246 family)